MSDILENIANSLRSYLNPSNTAGVVDIAIPAEPAPLELPEHLRPTMPRPLRAEDVVSMEAFEAAVAQQRKQVHQILGRQRQRIEESAKQSGLEAAESADDMKQYWSAMGHEGDSLPYDSQGKYYVPEGPVQPPEYMDSSKWERGPNPPEPTPEQFPAAGPIEPQVPSPQFDTLDAVPEPPPRWGIGYPLTAIMPEINLAEEAEEQARKDAMATALRQLEMSKMRAR